VSTLYSRRTLCPALQSTNRVKVLWEWQRVVRPGGAVFIAQHNFIDAELESILRNSGWTQTDLLRGVRPDSADATGFQIFPDVRLTARS
jgi:hypothetical protein